MFAQSRAAARLLLDFALPPRCNGCGLVVGDDGRFCYDCWSKLRLLGEPACACCGRPFDYARGPDAVCGSCLAEPPPFDRLRAAVAYGEVARKVALKLKDGNRPGVARTMAGLMARQLDGTRDALLIPVPLHRWRIWRRGYNQAALIAGALARDNNRLSVDLHAIERVKHTPPLKGLSRAQRGRALQGAFRVPDRDRVTGRHLVLIDDVYTSGATAGACARTLRKAGAARVDILCWARVLEDEFEPAGVLRG